MTREERESLVRVCDAQRVGTECEYCMQSWDAHKSDCLVGLALKAAAQLEELDRQLSLTFEDTENPEDPPL